MSHGPNEKGRLSEAGLFIATLSNGLFDYGATAVDGPGDVAIGGVERLQGCSAGKINPLKAELAGLSLFHLVQDPAAALDAGIAKLLHCVSSFFLLHVLLSAGTKKGSPYGRATRLAASP
jgi:hypothetical protein